MTPVEAFFDKVFHICVDILFWIADHTGWTYEEANIWLFVIIHPIITLIFIYTTYKYRKQFINQKL